MMVLPKIVLQEDEMKILERMCTIRKTTIDSILTTLLRREIETERANIAAHGDKGMTPMEKYRHA